MAEAISLEGEFSALLACDELAIPVAAIEVLLGVIKRSKSATMHGLDEELRSARDRLLAYCGGAEGAACLQGRTAISLGSGCELFTRYATRTFLEFEGFDRCKEELLARGRNFAQLSATSRERIATLGHPFVRDGSVVLVHGRSRVVVALLAKAATTKQFSVIVTEGRPQGAGYSAAAELAAAGVPVTVVLDSAVGYFMERVDMVLVGAEGVVENGGVINKVGTLVVAACAKAFHKPLYVAAESYKFARLYPLNQRDLPASLQDASVPILPPDTAQLAPNVVATSPACDYTPPNYITLLFTDLGVLTPSAVSDELIRLYQ